MTKAVEKYIDDLIEREGGDKFVNHPSDRGGPTRYGVTQAVARAFGYDGPMETLPLDTARAIFRRRYWDEPGFGRVAQISETIAEELFDTGVNMGPGPVRAIMFLQRSLNGLNLRGKLYPDLGVDGRIGPMTLHALDRMLDARGQDGTTVLMRMLNALQAVRYLEISEGNESQEDFMFGWLRTRVA